ncbi:hypothetical protein NJ7G_3948 [Natrinema sp. J7-2]|nr:hypothetical protein NJ7G_3948 [Natrinema sp. J7-2]
MEPVTVERLRCTSSHARHLRTYSPPSLILQLPWPEPKKVSISGRRPDTATILAGRREATIDAVGSDRAGSSRR